MLGLIVLIAVMFAYPFLVLALIKLHDWYIDWLVYNNTDYVPSRYREEKIE